MNQSLDIYEQSLWLTVKAFMRAGNAAPLTRRCLMRGAKMSRSQVVRCEESLSRFGLLRVAPTRHKYVFLYEAVRLQGDLFDPKSNRQLAREPGRAVKSEQKTAQGGVSTGTGAVNESSPDRTLGVKSSPGGHDYLSVTPSVNSKDKYRPPPESFPKNRKEQEAAKEARVGSAPSPANLGVRRNEAAAERIRRRLGIAAD